MNKYEVQVYVDDLAEKVGHVYTVVIEANSHTQAMNKAKNQVWYNRYFDTHPLHDVQVLAVRRLDYTEPTFTDKLVVMLLRPVTGLARGLLGFIRRFKDE